MHVRSRLLRRALHKASLSAEARALCLETILQHLKAAYKEYYKTTGLRREIRDSALEECAAVLAAEGNTKKEKISRALCHRDKQQSTARKIRALRGNGTFKDLTGKQ